MFSMNPGSPPLVASEVMGVVKDLVHGSREAGATIMRRDVINIAHGVILSTIPGLLKENGGSTSITLTDRWARNTLKSISMVKQQPSVKFLSYCTKKLNLHFSAISAQKFESLTYLLVLSSI